jgi:tyrosine-specific transport protein
VNKKFLYAVSVLIGTMVGVGIFGMPFAFAKAGFWVGIGMLFIIGLATLLVDLMYGEVALRTEGNHQLLGYTKKYLGIGFQRAVLFSTVLTGYVAILAYIIVSGDFLNTLLSPLFYAPVSTYSVLFFSILSLVILKGIKTISRLESFLSSLFIITIGLIFFTGFHHINTNNFQGFIKEYTFLPYGIILFAFGGLLAIPVQRQILLGQERKLSKAILFAILITSGLYALFATTVVGISGDITTPDAISGLYESLGPTITILGSAFGLLAITSSFLMLSSGMIQMFNLDFKMKKFQAWLLVITPPIILFWAGIRTFVDVISLAGGVALALEQILVVFLYAKAKSHGNRIPEYSLNIPIWLLYIIILVFAGGIGYFIFIK